MPNRHSTLTSLFEDIADAIRAKTGSASDIVADNFDTAIAAIPTSGGSSDDYFWIENTNNFDETLTIKAYGDIANLIDVALKYSSDKNTWTDITVSTTATTLTIPANQKIYLKNTKDSFSISNNGYINFRVNGNHNVGGRITSLINNIDGKGITPNCFQYLFYSDTLLVNASSLVLPNYVNTNCYYNMFGSCTSLVSAPALPATQLANTCYRGMFNGCSSLTTPPALPATVLASDCYRDMFAACTSLTSAPILPATILAANCYQAMFQGCTALTSAPALPATTLATYCYYAMFSGCTALTTASALPATTLSANCYQQMFATCTSLVTVPALPATTLASSCYQQMFSGCSSLKVYTTSDAGHDKAWNIPSGGSITGTTRSQSNMFSNVDTDSVPATFPGASGTQYTYYTQNTPVSAS